MTDLRCTMFISVLFLCLYLQKIILVCVFLPVLIHRLTNFLSANENYNATESKLFESGLVLIREVRWKKKHRHTEHINGDI